MYYANFPGNSCRWEVCDSETTQTVAAGGITRDGESYEEDV